MSQVENTKMYDLVSAVVFHAMPWLPSKASPQEMHDLVNGICNMMSDDWETAYWWYKKGWEDSREYREGEK